MKPQQHARYAGIKDTLRQLPLRLLAAGAVVCVAAAAFVAVNRAEDTAQQRAPEQIADSVTPLAAVAIGGTDVSGVRASALRAETGKAAVSADAQVEVEMYATTQLMSFAVQGWQAIPYTVTYASSNEAVCTVDGNGLVSGLAEGDAVITATATDAEGNTASATCNVTVTYAPPPLESIALNRSKVTLRMGGTGSNLTVSCTPEEYTELAPAPVFASSDEGVCTVDETGHITAVAPGEAVVTAAVGSLTAECAVTVKDTETVNQGGIALLSFDHSMIAGIGNQTAGRCSWYALRYARTILDGTPSSGSGMWSGGAVWSAAGYYDYSADLSSCLSKLYSELNAGRPVIVHLQNTYVGDGNKHANRVSSYEYWESAAGWNPVLYPHIATSSTYGHWVCVVGYREGADPNNLQESDFYALDPARVTDGSSICVTNLLNGTLWVGNSPLKVAG